MKTLTIGLVSPAFVVSGAWLVHDGLMAAWVWVICCLLVSGADVVYQTVKDELAKPKDAGKDAS